MGFAPAPAPALKGPQFGWVTGGLNEDIARPQNLRHAPPEDVELERDRRCLDQFDKDIFQRCKGMPRQQ